ncbi:MAG: galactan export ABC transporter permease subunit Wzm/RfbD [Sciscionella sp.]
MQATSRVEQPVDPTGGSTPTRMQMKSSRSWERVFDDIHQGLRARELWAHLGWQDIRQRYRRSILGPFWITISQGVIALGLGLLYGVLFGSPFETFLPYVSTGLIVWTFISNCLMEGMETFIANEGLIKHLPAPLSVYALRTVWRQMIMFAHNIIVYVIVFAIFFKYLDQPYSLNTKGACVAPMYCHPGLSWTYLLAIPGFLLVVLNAAWVSMFLGIISTRFRDFPQLVGALIQLLFYMTPIVWPVDQLLAPGGHRHALAQFVKPLLDLNPFYHLIQVVRGPLTGGGVSWVNWAAVGLMTVVGWSLALMFMRNYRARVSYWV